MVSQVAENRLKVVEAQYALLYQKLKEEYDNHRADARNNSLAQSYDRRGQPFNGEDSRMVKRMIQNLDKLEERKRQELDERKAKEMKLCLECKLP